MNEVGLLVIWSIVIMFVQVLFALVLVSGIRSLLRRNERLTLMLAVGNAHGGKGTEAARANVAAIKEMNKKADKVAAGMKPSAEVPRRGLRLKQSTP
jgi:MoxR-like ATPase